jgi:hypothetical protein
MVTRHHTVLDLAIERPMRHLKLQRGLCPIGWHAASLLRHAKVAPAVVDEVAHVAQRRGGTPFRPAGFAPGDGVVSAAIHDLRAAVAEVARPRVTLLSWSLWPFANATLIGHAEADFGGWIIAKIPVFRKADGGLSVGVPTAAEVGRDGVQSRDRDGRRRFTPVMRFSSDGLARWQHAVLPALDEGGIVL